MGFIRADFALAVQGTQKVFTYKTADTIAAVSAADYFLEVADEVDQFDVIIAVTDTGTAAAASSLVVTSERGAASVTTG